MTYKEQLVNIKWQNKRKEILEIDGYKCQNCFNKSLIEKYNISFVGVGLTKYKLIYILIDKESLELKRCVTDFEKSFLSELLKHKEDGNILALSNESDGFSSLIGTVIIKPKIEILSNISKLDTNNQTDIKFKQKTQENTLRSLNEIQLKELKWINTKSLHVHHKYYQIGKMAWEYPNTALTTLCWACHEDLHKNTLVDIYDENNKLIDSKNICPRCFGAGWFPEYIHIESGICFMCLGRRFLD